MGIAATIGLVTIAALAGTAAGVSAHRSAKEVKVKKEEARERERKSLAAVSVSATPGTALTPGGTPVMTAEEKLKRKSLSRLSLVSTSPRGVFSETPTGRRKLLGN